MPPKTRVIIDTDPGVDDVHALLFALAASPEDLELLLISVTWGNVSVRSCLRNVVSLFHVIQKDLEWREMHGQKKGFRMLQNARPLVAVGAEGPLNGDSPSADHFHGKDGLAGIYSKHPHFSPSEAWEHLFDEPHTDSLITTEAQKATGSKVSAHSMFTPSTRPSHLEMLDLLASNPEDTIDIIAVGPLTTVAQAAAADPKTFLRARRLIIMGGALEVPGNITPLAEFNVYADAIAAARLFALTSPNPLSTFPRDSSGLKPYPHPSDLGERRLDIVLFPLDITEQHAIPLEKYVGVTNSIADHSSPLAEFATYLFTKTFEKNQSMNPNITGLTLHDPICVWYALSAVQHPELWGLSQWRDIRVEATGQWTRGYTVIDKRDRMKMEEQSLDDNDLREIIGDAGGWLSNKRGNRIKQCIKTPGWERFADEMLETIFGGA